jgi:hypothetical protein
MDWVSVLFVLVFISLLVYHIFNKQASAKIMDELLVNYYKDNGLNITDISKLSVSERIKYGAPVSPFIKLQTSTFSIFTNSNESFFRKIETIDDSDKEHIRYVELSLNNSGVNVEEFDVYEF